METPRQCPATTPLRPVSFPPPPRPAPPRPLSAVARDLPKLRANGITHVLNAAGVACPNYHEGSLEYLTLNLYVTPRNSAQFWRNSAQLF